MEMCPARFPGLSGIVDGDKEQILLKSMPALFLT
jgi:hypothetical protein